MMMDFRVSIRQEPIRGRMCGLGGNVARRMLDPPLIVQLDFEERREFTEAEVATVALRFLSHVTIQAVCGDSNSSVKDAHILITKSSRITAKNIQSQYLSTLLGQRVVSSVYLEDCNDGKKRFFFVFADLAIRIQGIYTLTCNVVNIVRFELLRSTR
jgi:hypothetical protein